MTVKTIGFSSAGRPIRSYLSGTGPVRILINGAHHANEYITSCVLERFIGKLCAGAEAFSAVDNPHQILRRVFLCIVPTVNPDGAAIFTELCQKDEKARARTIAAGFPDIPFPDGWKANLNGVDLNLNYPAGWQTAREEKAALGVTGPAPRDWPGPHPLSEPETIAMTELTEVFDPHITISFHTQGQEIYRNYGSLEPAGSREIAEAMTAASGYSSVPTPLNAGHAGYKDWFIQTYNRPGFTVEAGLGENPLPFSQIDTIYDECEKIILAAVEVCGDYVL